MDVTGAAGLLAVVDEAMDGLAMAEVPVSPVTCMELSERLLGVLDRAESVLAGWVGKVDSCRGAQGAGHPSTAAWLRIAGGMRHGRAVERVHLARQLPRLAETAARLADGRLSAGYAVVIAEAVSRLNDEDAAMAEEGLLAWVAEGKSVKEVAWLARRIHDVVNARDGKDPDREPEDARHGYLASWLKLEASLDGGAYVSGWLSPEHAALWHAALDPLARPAGDKDPRDHGQRFADAAYTRLSGGGGHWDALYIIDHTATSTYGGHHAAPSTDPVNSDRDGCDRDGKFYDGGGGVHGGDGEGVTGARLPDGTSLRPRRTAQLLLNGTITTLMLDEDGQPLKLGRTSRLVSAAQRRVLHARYNTCSVIGCAIPARLCEIDHITPWAKGGTTDLANLAPKCHFHNQYKQNHPGRITETFTNGRWETAVTPRDRPP